MSDYDHKKIETKWQKVWEKKKVFAAEDFSKKPKFYGLIEFPYPSGEGLHVGHIRSNTAMDIISRKRRMEGFNVLYPIGWDAFGLPTENYAIKTGIHPTIVTKKNTDTFRRQLKSLGYSFDWSREINTTDPAYYKWTQWIFLQFFKHGLAYKKKMPINWCPKDKIGLANEEVVNGCCERCGTPVEKRDKEQWMLAITKYAERLDKDLDEPIIVRGEKNELPKKILVGTRNPAKVKMVIAAFPKELGIEFVSLNDVPSIDDSALV
ncbi:class I tRNA ligase family protein, partial [Patescibacteria group bacterium]|nr:class I tRNA ligase family protein [Patescibacteria group bacterium]